MIPQDRDEFCRKSRYLYEIADFLGVARTTLRAWLQDCEALSDIKVKKLYPPQAVKRIVDYFGV
ncbi:MAG: hypothetical protein ACI3Z9_01990 [Candidatus Onthomorpha sp.]